MGVIALNLDGTDDQVDYGDIAAISGAAALTVLLWARRDTDDTEEHLVSKGRLTNGLSSSFALGADSTNGQRLRVDIPNGTTHRSVISDANNFGTANGYQHVGFVFSGAGTSATLYVNGAAVAATTSGALPATLSATTVTFRVGTSRADDNFFDGQVALLKVWTAALTAAEVAAEMWAYRPRRTDSLLLYVPCDDGASAIDYATKTAATVTGATVATTSPPLNVGARVL